MSPQIMKPPHDISLQHHGNSMPDDQSVISGIAARYNHESGQPKTIELGQGMMGSMDPNNHQMMIDSGKLGF